MNYKYAKKMDGLHVDHSLATARRFRLTGAGRFDHEDEVMGGMEN